jgi:hypothetical protein
VISIQFGDNINFEVVAPPATATVTTVTPSALESPVPPKESGKARATLRRGVE